MSNILLNLMATVIIVGAIVALIALCIGIELLLQVSRIKSEVDILFSDIDDLRDEVRTIRKDMIVDGFYDTKAITNAREATHMEM